MQRAVGTGRAKRFTQSWPFHGPGGAGVRAVLREMAASLSAAARGVSDTLPSHRAACSLRGALRGGSAAPKFGGHRAAGREEQAEAPLCLAALLHLARQHGDTTLSAQQNGHFSSS